MSAVNDILNMVPVDQLARQVGADPQQTEQAVAALVPELVNSMQQNTSSPEGMLGLASALLKHGESGLFAGSGSLDNLDAVDTADGAKIVQHVFGGGTDQVAQQLSASGPGGAVGADLIKKVLPYLAPIVLAYLAKQFQGGKYGNILGSILGGHTGGGQTQAPAQTQTAGGGNILGDILGSILGGGAAGGPAGSIPGSIPGGGQQEQAPAPQATFPTQSTGAAGEATMDAGAAAPQEQQPPTGGGIMDALKNIFGRSGN